MYGSFSMRAGLKASQNDSFFWWKGINSPRLLVIHSNSFSNVWTLLTLTVEQVGSFVIPLPRFHGYSRRSARGCLSVSKLGLAFFFQ